MDFQTDLADVTSLTLEQGPRGQWTLRVVLGPATETSGAVDAGQPSVQPLAAEVQAVLRRHLSYDPASRTRDVTDAFLALGWVPAVAGDGTSGPSYVRWTRHGSHHSAVLYADSQSVNARGEKMRAVAEHLPGADVKPSAVTFMYRKRYDEVIAMIDSITRWCDDAE